MPSVAIANAWYHHRANGGKKTLPSRQQVSSFVKMCLEDRSVAGAWCELLAVSLVTGDWEPKEAVWSMNDQAAVVVVAAGNRLKTHVFSSLHTNIQTSPIWDDSSVIMTLCWERRRWHLCQHHWCKVMRGTSEERIGRFFKASSWTCCVWSFLQNRKVEHDLKLETKVSQTRQRDPLEGVQLFVFLGKGINRYNNIYIHEKKNRAQ